MLIDLDVVWLSSFPRSGNTFLRTILNHCFGLKSCSIYPKDFLDNPVLENYVGHLEHNPDNSLPLKPGKLNLIKTHGAPDDSRRAIYIVRDGRAALASFYHFYNGQVSLKDVIEGNHYFGNWSRSVLNWDPEYRPNTLLLKYEDLRDNVGVSLFVISQFLGVPVIGTSIPKREEIANKEGRWVRKKTDWRETFTPEAIDLFNRLHGRTMERMGYSIDVD